MFTPCRGWQEGVAPLMVPGGQIRIRQQCLCRSEVKRGIYRVYRVFGQFPRGEGVFVAQLEGEPLCPPHLCFRRLAHTACLAYQEVHGECDCVHLLPAVTHVVGGEP